MPHYRLFYLWESLLTSTFLKALAQQNMSYPHKHLKPLAVLASVMGNPLQNKLNILYTLFPGLVKSTYSRLQDQ